VLVHHLHHAHLDLGTGARDEAAVETALAIAELGLRQRRQQRQCLRRALLDAD